MSYFYCDVETLGLDLIHPVWEIGYAFDDEPVTSCIVSHSNAVMDSEALEVNGYSGRGGNEVDGAAARVFEQKLLRRLDDERPVFVGANPAFDAERLLRRWGLAHSQAPWHYRLLDATLFAAPLLGWNVQASLARTANAFRDMGYVMPEPDHTAAGDVEAARAVYRASLGLQAVQRMFLKDSGASR